MASSFWDTPTDAKSQTPAQAIRKLLDGVTCGSIAKSTTPIVIDSALSLIQASQLLAEKRISSAPVYDKTSASYLRLLDWSDINAMILQFIIEGNRQSLLTNNNTQLEEMFAKINVKIIPNNFVGELSKQHPFHTVTVTDPLYAAVKLFTAATTKVYRAVVLNADGSFHSILSQSDAIRFVSTHLNDENIKSLTAKSLGELKLVQSEVVSIDGSASVLEALALLVKRHMSSVAVVVSKSTDTATATATAAAGTGGGATSAAAKQFIGAITHGHIKYLFRKRMYASLTGSCASVLEAAQKANADENPDFACVTAETTLAHAIKRIVGHRFQRVWVVDSAGQPIGIVSLTDILRIITA